MERLADCIVVEPLCVRLIIDLDEIQGWNTVDVRGFEFGTRTSRSVMRQETRYLQT